MLDDVARAFTRYPVLGCGASPSQIHGRNLLILSDNISAALISNRAAPISGTSRQECPTLYISPHIPAHLEKLCKIQRKEKGLEIAVFSALRCRTTDLDRTQEVAGSSPASSTAVSPAARLSLASVMLCRQSGSRRSTVGQLAGPAPCRPDRYDGASNPQAADRKQVTPLAAAQAQARERLRAARVAAA